MLFFVFFYQLKLIDHLCGYVAYVYKKDELLDGIYLSAWKMRDFSFFSF